jgi:isopentenyl-diphosphate delta-isomerase
VGEVGADALCIHLNPAMELIQGDGDRDFSGVLRSIARLSEELSVPVIAKETGCGMSRDVLARLQASGVNHVDVSGAGGTSWVAVETHRASAERRRLGETFWEWGIPTAASTAFAAEAGFETIFATGGMKTGLDVAKAVALGASAGGIARPVLQALEAGGTDGARQLLLSLEQEVRSALLLCGAPNCAALRQSPRLVSGDLERWLKVER